MNNTKYKPQADSLPAQVIAFFKRNPDEALTMGDMVNKFDTPRTSIHSLLRKSVEVEVLERNINDENEYVYSAGKAFLIGIPTAATAPAAPRTVMVDLTPPEEKSKLRKIASSFVLTDPSELVVTNDPLPRGRATPGCKYDSLMRTLKVGQCIKCHPHEIGRVSGAMRKHFDTKQSGMAVKTIKNYGDGMGRVWLLKGESA